MATQTEAMIASFPDEFKLFLEKVQEANSKLSDQQLSLYLTAMFQELYKREGVNGVIYKIATTLVCMCQGEDIDFDTVVHNLLDHIALAYHEVQAMDEEVVQH